SYRMEGIVAMEERVVGLMDRHSYDAFPCSSSGLTHRKPRCNSRSIQDDQLLGLAEIAASNRPLLPGPEVRWHPAHDTADRRAFARARPCRRSAAFRSLGTAGAADRR